MIELLLSFLFELLIWLLALVFEILFEFALAAIVDFILRAIFSAFEAFASENRLLTSIGFLLLGTIAGGLSILLFPNPLMRPSRVPGISLLVSPIGTGLLMSWMGSFLDRHGRKITAIESFRYGWAFAFGVAFIRYVFVVRAG